MAANATETVTLNVTAPNTPGPITNKVITSEGSTDTVTTEVLPAANLVLTKRANPNPVDVGDNLVFILRVTNQGPNTANNVELSDDLPGNVILRAVDEDPNDRCLVGAGQVVDCTLNGPNGTNGLQPGESATVRVLVEPEEAGTVGNTARVESSTADPNPANNVTTVSVTAEGNNAGGGGTTPGGSTTPSGGTTPGGGGSTTPGGGSTTPGGGGGGNTVLSGDDNERDELTVIRENTVIRETIPGKNLPNTGGEAGGDASTAGLFAGAGVLVLLGAMGVRIYRFRNS